MLCSMRNLSSTTRDQTHAPSYGCTDKVLTTEPPRKSQHMQCLNKIDNFIVLFKNTLNVLIEI